MSEATYHTSDEGTYKNGEILANFKAEITKQIKRHDGRHTETFLVINGKKDDVELPQVQIPATEFGKFDWIPKHWGIGPIIYPIPNCERDLKTAIQSTSEPETIDVYGHTGWTKINDVDTYLHRGGGITPKGNDDAITVELAKDLQRYDLTPIKHDARTAFRASLNISTLGEAAIAWPLLLCCYRSVIDETDFSAHLSGRTGTFKSEFCSLLQSHFGKDMDARHLPASWSSTGNALECLCYATKDALITIDDFVPNGNSWQVRTLQKTADQLFRGQGNQAGRARLTDTTNLQQTMYPRGLILSTGEDIPTGHSIRARVLICDLTPGNIKAEALTKAQKHRPNYSQAMAAWIQYLAPQLKKIRENAKKTATAYRDKHRDLGHARTPAMIGELQAALEALLHYGITKKFIETEEAARLASAGEDALTLIGKQQGQYMKDADPTESFADVIKTVLASHLAHLRTKTNGIPDNPTIRGWTQTESKGGLPGFRAAGPTIGWVDDDSNELLIDQNQFTFLQKHGNGALGCSRQTLLKRLKDSGALARTDDLRQRNIMRVMCGGTQRSVICLKLKETLDNE